ncbi:MAG TPA: hypothetical protein VHE30_04855 [Polyangiaceae bacterium]|nr:hypothetical protein [Polyangiaceae bacterium]
MTQHRSLYVGFLFACVLTATLFRLATRRGTEFSTVAPLVTAASPHLDEWPPAGR